MSYEIIEDVWYTVFIYIQETKDALSLKNVCKRANDGFYLYVKSSTKTYPRRTFIKFNTCMKCDEKMNKINSIVYPDFYPPRISYYCNKFSCFSSILNTFCSCMENENTYPFIEEKRRQFYIRRTDGSYSKGTLQENKVHIKNSDIFCAVMFEEKKHETKQKIIFKTQPKNFSLHKLVNIKETEVVLAKLFWNIWGQKIRDPINIRLHDIPCNL